MTAAWSFVPKVGKRAGMFQSAKWIDATTWVEGDLPSEDRHELKRLNVTSAAIAAAPSPAAFRCAVQRTHTNARTASGRPSRSPQKESFRTANSEWRISSQQQQPVFLFRHSRFRHSAILCFATYFFCRRSTCRPLRVRSFGVVR